MYRTLATSSGSGALYRNFPESSGSGGAFQPAETNADASQLGGLPEVVELTSSLEPHLVIMVLTIDAAEHRDKHGLLISGSLHIRTPHGKCHPTVATKKRITKAALEILEERAYTASSGASQPAAPVIVLTGDDWEPFTSGDLVEI